nr:MAG TPA: hypothetical protein [Caudoviricetes sp.]
MVSKECRTIIKIGQGREFLLCFILFYSFLYANNYTRCKGMPSNRTSAFSLCILRLLSHYQRIIWLPLCYYSGNVCGDAPLVVCRTFAS